jgi:hypothetical protein
MAEQGASADAIARIEQAAAELRIPNTELTSVPKQLADIVAREGLQTSIGTIAHVTQYANGSHSVQFDHDNGGSVSRWPQWAFELAKEALLANKEIWVISNGEPIGTNLVNVVITRYP